jgi:hypothetical protein
MEPRYSAHHLLLWLSWRHSQIGRVIVIYGIYRYVCTSLLIYQCLRRRDGGRRVQPVPVPSVAGDGAQHGPPGPRRRLLLPPLPSRKSKRVVAPATWNGRFWARTGCNFTSNSNSNGTAACLTGDCEGRLACNGSIGLPPATLVEVSLRHKGSSSYDVSSGGARKEC